MRYSWRVRLGGGRCAKEPARPENHDHLRTATITVDDIEVGQFVYLLLHNEKIRNVLDTITSKVVLLLGRFTDDRKKVLNRLREELRHRNLSPVLFDFDPAANQDITDTVTLLARMARFVIADLTDPRSVQQELTLIATQVVVPIQPIILAGQQPWSMFTDLRRRSRGLLPVYEYVDIDDLLGGLQVHVIDPAENMRMELLHPTCAARPCCVAAAVTEAGLVAHQHLARAEAVSDRAMRGWVGDPLPSGGQY